MLQFKDNRFHAFGLSFTIPDGFFLETQPACLDEYGLVARTPDQKCLVDWGFEKRSSDPYGELCDLISPNYGMKLKGRIEPITMNGLSGFKAFFQTHSEQLLEVRLAAETGAGICVTVIIQNEEGDIQTVADSPEIQAVLDGIQLDT